MLIILMIESFNQAVEIAADDMICVRNFIAIDWATEVAVNPIQRGVTVLVINSSKLRHEGIWESEFFLTSTLVGGER
jgi:hypothetical protein